MQNGELTYLRALPLFFFRLPLELGEEDTDADVLSLLVESGYPKFDPAEPALGLAIVISIFARSK